MASEHHATCITDAEGGLEYNFAPIRSREWVEILEVLREQWWSPERTSP
jgi:hypothetical protein